MKVTVSSAELKNILSLVDTIVACSGGAKVLSKATCLLHGSPKNGKLTISFSVCSAYLSYEFSKVVVEGEEDAYRAVDLSVLSGLKFSDKSVTLELSTDEKTAKNTISFKSGRMTGKILTSARDLEEALEQLRPSEEEIPLAHKLSIADWLKALNVHLYGGHYSPDELEKRAVYVSHKDGNLIFVSQDKISSGYTVHPSKYPVTSAFEWCLLPAPLKRILSALSREEDAFQLGIGKESWRICHGKTNIWFPNISPPSDMKTRVPNLKVEVDTKPFYAIYAPLESFKQAIDELTPFLSNAALSAKDDLPIVAIKVSHTDKTIVLSVNTSKTRDVKVALEDSFIEEHKLTLDSDHTILVNFKFLTEFVSALAKCRVDSDPDSVFIKFWPYQDPQMPVRGRAVVLGNMDNMYLVSRVKNAGGAA